MAAVPLAVLRRLALGPVAGAGTCRARRRPATAALVVAALATSMLATCAGDDAGDGAGSATTEAPPTTGEAADTSADVETVPVPRVEGPVAPPGDVHLDPFEVTAPVSAEERGYVFEEHLVSGDAAGEPYAVRLLLARPDGEDAPPFSGHVLVEPKHGTGIPFLWHFTRDHLMDQGHAAVEVSLIPSTVERNLQGTDPERYADLQITEEQGSDVLAQVGALLKSDDGPLPDARWLHLTGHSMAVGPVRQYMDSHHELQRLADGGPVYDGFLPETTRTASRFGPFPDVDVPTILINSELEVDVVLVEEGTDYRKPDSDEPGRQFRLYEVAGMPHNPVWQYPLLADADLGDACDLPLNAFPYEPLVVLAFDHLVRWVEDGTPPPRAEPIATEGAPEAPTAIARDEHGNALGGVRSTAVDVPVATYHPQNTGDDLPVGDCLVYGGQEDFDAETLTDLYGDVETYRQLVDERLDELVDEGWLLATDADTLRGEAATFDGFDEG